MSLVRIKAPHFVAGVVLLDDCVIRVAPILKYMTGWNRRKIEMYCEKKGWKLEVLSNPEENAVNLFK